VSAAAAAAPRTATRAVLGRTGLEACRIGIGGGSGLPEADIEHALARGVNYLFVSSDFHAVMYHPMWRLLRRYGRGSRREGLLIAGCSYICDPEKLAGILADQLVSWGIDYVDVFQWGWVTERNDPDLLLRCADEGLRSAAVSAAVAEQLGVAEEVVRELRRRGYARFLAISTHDRAIARALAAHPRSDLLMVRYNLAHRGLEDDVFPHLAEPGRRPGLVAFNAAHDARGLLSRPPAGLPPGRYVPDVGDLYRFALDRAEIDVVLAGPANREQLDVALDALDRPSLDPVKRTYLERYGDLHAGRARLRAGTAGLSESRTPHGPAGQ
jgi:aryl-alcohol dehydrogenase-like predicted oxidoreductase